MNKKFVYIILANVRSIANKLHAFKLFIKYHNPDVMAVTESWGRPELTDSLISQPGYQLFRKDRSVRRGGGFFLLVRSDSKPVEYLFQSNEQALFEDSVWCSLNNPTNVLIGCLYRSPLSSCSNDAILCSLVNEACLSFDGHKMILGDFNCPDIDWEHISSQPSTQFLVDCCNNNFLHQMVTVPTRGDNILDLVFVDDSSFVADLHVSAPFPGSDHLSVNVTIEFDNFSNSDNGNYNLSKSFDFSKA